MPPDPIVICGVGVVHGLGSSWREFGHQLALGQSALKPLDEHPTLSHHESKARVFGWVDLPPVPLVPSEKAHQFSRLARLVLACVAEAGEQAGAALDPSRTGVYLGTGLGNLADLDPIYARYHTPGGKRRLSPLTLPVNMNNSAANLVSQVLGAQGPSQMVGTACASGLTALIQGAEALRRGEIDRALAGGADLTICPSLIDAWDKLGVLSPEVDPPKACRPLQVDRTGLVLSEGAATFVVERLSTCLSRGARPLAILTGWAQNCDAFDLVAPRQTTQVACLRAALENASLVPDALDLVHLHATGTPRNDRQELEVLETVFGSRLTKLPLAATKGQTGHAMGASGTLSLAAVLHSWSWGTSFPLLERNQTDWETPLRLDGSGQVASQNALIECFAFGGTNTALVLHRPQGGSHGPR